MQNNERLEQLVKRIHGGRAVLFCGAGISIQSGLPSAMALADRICGLVCPSENSRRVLLEEVCTHHRIPFEAFIEIIIRVSGNGSFLEMFSEGEPAAAHLAAAHMAKKCGMKVIATTNFDLLFERAIQSAAVPKQSWRVFADDEDFAGLSDAVLAELPLALLKVHGSYGTGASGMLTTLRQLGQKRLLEERLKAIDYVFRTGPHELVVIIGYSCSDVFDINPRIASLAALSKSVVLIEHTSNGQTEEFRLNAATRFPQFARCNDDSWCVRTDTNKFLAELLSVLEVSSPRRPASSDLWSKHVTSWFEAMAPDVADRIVAAIFRRCGRYELAEIHYLRAVRILEGQKDSETLADVHTQIGALKQLQGRYLEASESYEHALNLLSEEPSRVRSTALYQIGRVKEETGDYRAALLMYEESMAIDQQLGDRAGVASCLHQTGIVYQEYLHDLEEAERRYKTSLEIKSDLGDLEGTFNTLHQLSTVEFLRHQHIAALGLNDQALDLALRLNLKHSVAYARSHRGYILQALTRYDEAEVEHRECLRIREELNDVKGISRSYHRLSEIELARGNLVRATRFILRSIRLKRSVNDRLGQAEDYLQIGAVLELAGHVVWADRARLDAQRQFEAIGFHREAADAASKRA